MAPIPSNREKFGRGDHIELLYVFIPQNCNSQPVEDLRKILKELKYMW